MKRTQTMISVLAMLLALMFTAGLAMAAEEEHSNEPPKVKPEWFYKDLVDADFVKEHITIPRTDDVMIIDARPYMTKYALGYIPTAVNIPQTKNDEMASLLPKNKDALLIFYCGGYHCKLSHKAAKVAEKLGYKNIKVYAAGFPDWKRHGYDVAVESEYVKNLLAEGKKPYLLIDARPLNKFLEGAIPGSVSIPDSKFDEFKGVLPSDKSTQLVYYCGGFKCKLSHKSADKAKKLGYTNVVVNESGYPGWKEKFGGSQAASISADVKDGAIDVTKFEAILKDNPDSIMLVDVRDADEFKAGHFPTAINMPVDEVEKKIAEFTADKPIIFVCSTGARSGEAFYMFLDKRPDLKDVYYLEATVDFHKDGTAKITPNK
ncbi:rhodanese-like domain-containing protein [Desulfovibrio inopinatus]|uniref:rhodanese-like domain-containing protein n=1 Tax=Desulfovibrio inopinatus TaxID=102109 RepID=UPI0003FF8136|nr:rhodanese-like domain-containing protein [Desulfovibrio inopinatus]